MNHSEIADLVIRLCNDVLFSLTEEQKPQLPELSPEVWDEVLRFASRQGVLPLIMARCKDFSFTEKQTRRVMMKWFASANNVRQRYELRLQTMQELTVLFKKQGIDVMFFKGAVLAQLYPDPSWRVFSDIDYYLFGQSEEGIDVLASHGVQNKDYYHHHTQATLHGILLENHYDFVERINHTCDPILDDALKKLAASEGKKLPAKFLGDEATNAYVMTPTMNAIFLMRHMSAHFVSETIPLRQLYDWALFLSYYGQQVNWEQVLHLYQTSGMTIFAGIVQQILSSYMGLTTNDNPISVIDGPQTQRVWESIIQPLKNNPYKKYSLRYYFVEAHTFLTNRWKHTIVYPGESYCKLALRYALSIFRRETGQLEKH